MARAPKRAPRGLEKNRLSRGHITQTSTNAAAEGVASSLIALRDQKWRPPAPPETAGSVVEGLAENPVDWREARTTMLRAPSEV